MTALNVRRPALVAVLLVLALAGCAAGPSARQTYADDAYRDAAFRDFLVIGVTGDYNNRAQFERAVVSGLRSAGVAATAYYTLAGRKAVLAAVEEHGFDAVVVSRVVSQAQAVDVREGSASARATTVGGGPLNLFRYDYEEFNEPGNMNLSLDITLATELFSAADEKMIWAVEHESAGADNVGPLIDDLAAAVVASLVRDGRLGT